MKFFFRKSLDRRIAEVDSTIKKVRSLGLDCDRTVRNGEYRITLRTLDGLEIRYARTPQEALSIAKMMKETLH
jgi:hypothetical protein